MKNILSISVLLISHSALAGTVYLSANTPDRPLPDCEGTVNTQLSGDQLTVAFQGVKHCTNFDVVNSNFEPTEHGNKTLSGSIGSKAGTYQIPKEYVDRKHNQMILKLQSDDNQVGDAVVIQFDAPPGPVHTPTPTPAPAPAPRTGRHWGWN